jgi:hypothetical protein
MKNLKSILRNFFFLLIVSLIVLTSISGFGNTNFAPLPPPPQNDDCAGAIFITPSTTAVYATYSNSDATPSVGLPAPGCATYIEGDVWFAVIVPPSGHLIFDAKAETMMDGGMAIYSGSCLGLTLLACNDNKATGDNMPQIDKFGLPMYLPVYIRFWGKGGNNFGSFQLAVIYSPPQPPCYNLGFEHDYDGWFATLGQQYEGVAGAATPVYYPKIFNTTANSNFTITTLSSGNDPYGGFPQVYSGTKSIKIGDIGTYEIYDGASIEQSFTVGINTNFIYHYALVLQTGGHPYYQQPFFKCDLYDKMGNPINCANATIAMPNTSLTQVGSSNTYYKTWTTVSVNLSDYINQNVTVRFTISDCSPGAHWGYAYLDCECQPFEILGFTDAFCEGLYDTLSAPAGALSYLWSPGGDTTPSIVVNPSENTTYQCTVTTQGNTPCTSTISKTVIVDPLPHASVEISSHGNDTIELNEINALYTVPVIDHATFYTWSYSGTGVSFLPSDTTVSDSVWMNFTANATSGNLTVKGNNACGSGIASANYPISTPIGINENINNLYYKLYPNPSKGKIMLEMDGINENTEVSVYNLQGEKIYSESIMSSPQRLKKEMNFSGFTKGIYFIKINTSKFIKVEKLVLQ